MPNWNVDVLGCVKTELKPATCAVERKARDASLLNEDELLAFPVTMVGACLTIPHREEPKEAPRSERQVGELGYAKSTATVGVSE